MSKGVLFVCLGNICRSPIAEAIFIDLVEKQGLKSQWKIDSAAIGPWHVGKKADHRALKTLTSHGIEYNNRARQVKKEDFNEYDYIFGMDDENIRDLEDMAPKNCKAKIGLLGEYDPQGKLHVRDPYYDSGSQGFEDCYIQCLRCLQAFLEKVK